MTVDGDVERRRYIDSVIDIDGARTPVESGGTHWGDAVGDLIAEVSAAIPVAIARTGS